MLFWLLFLLLSSVAIALVLYPVLRPLTDIASRSSHDMRVYRDQLAEIDRELARNLISEQEAESSRVEISRRILAASSQSEDEGRQRKSLQSARVRKSYIALFTILIPTVTLLLYLFTGNPGLPDMPLAARLSAAPEEQDILLLVRRVEEQLAENPEDARGWEVIAPVYYGLDEHEKAADAYRNVIRLSGANIKRWTRLGQAITYANDGNVVPEAKSAFQEALKIYPYEDVPRLFLGRELRQSGKYEEAVTAWRDMLRDADGTEYWVKYAKDEIELLKLLMEQRRLEEKKQELTAGPTDDEINAASSMTAEERSSMIGGMVEGLEIRLLEEGGTVEEWQRLIRSLVVLGRTEDANEIIKRALFEFKDDESARERIKETARSAGLDIPEEED